MTPGYRFCCTTTSPASRGNGSSIKTTFVMTPAVIFVSSIYHCQTTRDLSTLDNNPAVTRLERCVARQESQHNTLVHCQAEIFCYSVAERLTKASAWYPWHREEVHHGYHQAMGSQWRGRSPGHRTGRAGPPRY